MQELLVLSPMERKNEEEEEEKEQRQKWKIDRRSRLLLGDISLHNTRTKAQPIMNLNDENDDRTVNNLPNFPSQLNGCTSKEESDLILRIRRTILHLDEESTNDRSSPKKDIISSLTLSSATLEFKVERAKQKFAAGSFEEAFYECWKIPQEQRPLEIWKLGGECCKKLRVFAVAQRWFSEAIHVCRSNNTDLNVKLEQARIARFFNNYLTQYPAIDIRVDQRGKGRSTIICFSSSICFACVFKVSMLNA